MATDDITEIAINNRRLELIDLLDRAGVKMATDPVDREALRRMAAGILTVCSMAHNNRTVYVSMAEMFKEMHDFMDSLLRLLLLDADDQCVPDAMDAFVQLLYARMIARRDLEIAKGGKSSTAVKPYVDAMIRGFTAMMAMPAMRVAVRQGASEETQESLAADACNRAIDTVQAFSDRWAEYFKD